MGGGWGGYGLAVAGYGGDRSTSFGASRGGIVRSIYSSIRILKKLNLPSPGSSMRPSPGFFTARALQINPCQNTLQRGTGTSGASPMGCFRRVLSWGKGILE